MHKVITMLAAPLARVSVLGLLCLAAAACGRTTVRAPHDMQAARANELVRKGAEAYRNGQLDSALADFDEAIRIDPESADAYRNRALIYQDRNDLAGALSDLDRALQINPRLPAALVDRGIARQERGDLAGALADFDAALRINPGLAEAYNSRGVAREATDDLTGALADYGKAIEINHDYADAYLNRGLALLAFGKDAQASKDFDEYTRLKPDQKAHLEQEISGVKTRRTAGTGKAR
jgi:tetratricopeptide (TPR) repeat protein